MQQPNSYRFFQNRECCYFPCHEVKDDSSFNCLFCYCPLYALGDQCGGNFCYTANGVKDCSHCTLPHSERGYDYIIANFEKISAIASKNRKEG